MSGRRKRKTAENDPAPADGYSSERARDAEELVKLLYLYAERYLAPRRMADMRRRGGDKDASPRDYDCRWPVPERDGLPDCWPHRVECRFRHRMRLRPKDYNNAFAHGLARGIVTDLREKLRQMSDREQLAMVVKMLAFGDAEGRREKRREHEPMTDAAPLREEWKQWGN